MSNEEKKMQEDLEQEGVEIPVEDGTEPGKEGPAEKTAEEKTAEETTEEAGGQTEGAAEAGEAPAGAGEGSAEAGEAAADAMTAKYMRLMADFQNFKKRTEKEKKDTLLYGNEKLIGSMLEVLDNFERALEQGSTDEKFLQGMKMIFGQLMGVLNKHGLAEIEALGTEFDPRVHSAVLAEDTEEYESGQVSGVVAKGYKLNDKVIRPSMVKVAK